jgi:hypothetical protein
VSAGAPPSHTTNFEVLSQPSSNEVHEITCLRCEENCDIRDLEYRHITGASTVEEFEDMIDKYHELTVWGLSKKLS